MHTDNHKDQVKSKASDDESHQLKDTIMIAPIQTLVFPSIQLNQPNEILPPNLHLQIIQKVSFKYKHQKEKHIFNHTTISNFPKVNQLQFNKINSSLDQHNKNYSEKQDQLNQEDLGEMQSFLQIGTKKLIYQRINNKMFNFINARDTKLINKNKINSQNRYFCSIFINPKVQKYKCQAKPLLQQLTKIYNISKVNNCEEDQLTFSSKFQSGNLFAVFKDVKSVLPTYEMFMQNDINTKGSNQWFCFHVTAKQRTKAKFRIVNFYKPTSLYEVGMKILVSTDFKDWKRVGTAISYVKNSRQDKTLYALEFIYQFENSSKPTYFSYGFPYTYSQNLSIFIDNIWRISQPKKCLTKITLCKSTLGNSVYMFNITNNIQAKKVKPLIYIIGRQHPGETPPSYIIQGLINFLLSSRIQANALRQNFQFRIVPMVNVDGVINGNYRTNISGNDINRQWMFPSKNLHPQIFHLKQQVLSNKKNVIFFLDIHAHSRKMNSFFYGSPQLSKQNKFYPFVCSKLNKFINYSQCAFGDDSSKKTTARVVLQKQLNILNSLTFEVSFYGWIDQGKKQKHHFKVCDFQQIGSTLALAFYYSQIGIKKLKQPNQDCINQANTQKQKVLQKNSLKIYQKWKKQLQKQLKQQEALSQGSSLDPQHFQLNQQQQKFIDQQVQVYQKQLLKQKKKRKNDNGLQHSQKSKNQQIFFLNQKQSPRQKQQNQNNLAKQSNLFSYSGKEFFLMSSKNFMVKKLQSELQSKKDFNKSIQTERQKKLEQLKLGKGQTILNQRYASLQSNNISNYRQNVLQIKKAYKYCLESKDTSYNSFRSYYKSFNNNAIPFQKKKQLSPLSLSITQTPKNKFKINSTRYYKKG